MSVATRKPYARPSPVGLGLTVLAGLLVVAGVATLVDATNRWQGVMNTVPCGNQVHEVHVLGYGNGVALVLGALSLVLVGITGWEALGPRRWGMATSVAAIVPIGVLSLR